MWYRRRKYCDQPVRLSVCVCVCLLAYLRNRASNIHRMFRAGCQTAHPYIRHYWRATTFWWQSTRCWLGDLHACALHTHTHATLHLWPTLARCGRSSDVQIRCHHAQMSAWQGSAVPRGLLRTGHWCCRQAASQVGYTATDGGPPTSAIHCWTPSIRCAWPHGLELCRTTSAHSRTTSPLDRVWKPGFSPDTSVFSALKTFVIIVLYKSTFTIPYHYHTAWWSVQLC